jgi:hypothetical protein
MKKTRYNHEDEYQVRWKWRVEEIKKERTNKEPHNA